MLYLPKSCVTAYFNFLRLNNKSEVLNFSCGPRQMFTHDAELFLVVLGKCLCVMRSRGC